MIYGFTVRMISAKCTNEEKSSSLHTILLACFLSHYSFNLMKQLLIPDKDNLSEYKMQFLLDNYIY